MPNLTMEDYLGVNGGQAEKLVTFILDVNTTAVSLENYVSRPENYLALDEVVNSHTVMMKIAESATAMNALLGSMTTWDAVCNAIENPLHTAMKALMSNLVSRQILFNSSQAQYSFRNSINALAYLDSIKTTITTTAVDGNIHQMVTDRDCFMLFMVGSGYVNNTSNSCRNYKHITDGITDAVMVGPQNTPNLINRFMTSIEMYLYNTANDYTRTAHVVYFD